MVSRRDVERIFARTDEEIRREVVEDVVRDMVVAVMNELHVPSPAKGDHRPCSPADLGHVLDAWTHSITSMKS